MDYLKQDILAIENLLDDLSTDAGFPAGTKPFFYHEVIDMGGEPITVDQYYQCGNIVLANVLFKLFCKL